MESPWGSQCPEKDHPKKIQEIQVCWSDLLCFDIPSNQHFHSQIASWVFSCQVILDWEDNCFEPTSCLFCIFQSLCRFLSTPQSAIPPKKTEATAQKNTLFFGSNLNNHPTIQPSRFVPTNRPTVQQFPKTTPSLSFPKKSLAHLKSRSQGRISSWASGGLTFLVGLEVGWVGGWRLLLLLLLLLF